MLFRFMGLPNREFGPVQGRPATTAVAAAAELHAGRHLVTDRDDDVLWRTAVTRRSPGHDNVGEASAPPAR